MFWHVGCALFDRRLFVRLSLMFIKWVQSFKIWNQIFNVKETKLVSLKVQTAILLNSEGQWMPRRGCCFST